MTSTFPLPKQNQLNSAMVRNMTKATRGKMLAALKVEDAEYSREVFCVVTVNCYNNNDTGSVLIQPEHSVRNYSGFGISSC